MTAWVHCEAEGSSRLRGDLWLTVDGPIPTAHSNGFGARKYDKWWIVEDGRRERVAAAEKPPYRIPTMREVEQLAPNGLTVASTFSGCGGSCLGFRMAGYRTVFASEFVPAAADTYRANHPGVPLDQRDVRELTGAEILAAAGVDEVDVLEGSPPCASFSTAGKLSAHWGEVKRYSDTEQRTDDLFFEYARLLGELRPRAFVAENVAGLARGVAKGYFKRVHAALAAKGYRVEARLLDAQWLGVPQARRRVIFVGIRDDLDRAPSFPAPLPHRYSIRDALPWLDGAGVVGWHGAPFDSKGQSYSTDEPLATICGGDGSRASQQFQVQVPALGNAIGVEWDKLQPGESSDRYFNLVRPDPDEPVPTVTQAGGNLGLASVTHPTERRKFTIEELRRLCGFPDDFVLTGTYAQQWERLGRAVPPPMMAAVARELAQVLS